MALAERFFVVAILFALIGMALGVWMGVAGPDYFGFAGLHAHIALAGWVTLFIYGLWYRGTSVAAVTGLAKTQFWVAIVGAVLFFLGVLGAEAQNGTLVIALMPGALLTLLAMFLFLLLVIRHRNG